jgi:hypothetical protein
MMQGRAPQPTTEQRRNEENQKKRQDRFATMQKHLSGAGAATRPTLNNIFAVFTHYPEWHGVFSDNGNNNKLAIDLVKPPPYHEDYVSTVSVPRTMDADDLARVAIWLEREAHMVIETKNHRVALRAAIRLAAIHGKKQ